MAVEVSNLGAGGRVKVIGSDVTNHELVASMVEQSVAEFGGVDVLVNAVIFLASDAASFITGQTLSVIGGYTMM